MGLKLFKLRSTLPLVLIVAVTLLLTACDSSSPTSPPPSPTAVTGNQGNLSGQVPTASATAIATTQATATATTAPGATVVIVTTAAATTTTASATTASTGGITLVPLNSNTKAITVNGPLEQQLRANLLGNNTSFSSAQYFSTRDSLENVIRYYDVTLGKNYTRVGRSNLNSLGGQLSNVPIPNGSVTGYRRNANAPADSLAPTNVSVVNIGPVTASFLSRLQTAAPDLANQLTVGDRLIIVLYNVPLGLG